MSYRNLLTWEKEDMTKKPELEDIEEVVSEPSDQRVLHCLADGQEFRITIPKGAKVTFSPWSPNSDSSRDYGKSRGTLRVYANKSPNADVLLVKSGVTEFRDLSLIDYEEATEEVIGNRVWRSDRNGYTMHEEVKKTPEAWGVTSPRELPKPTEE